MSSAPTAASETPAPQQPQPPQQAYNPEDYRMTIGEHLEELRKRMFLGVTGFIVAFIVAMIFGDRVVYFVCKPLLIALARNKVTPQIFFTDAAEPFMTYIKAAMITAGAAAGPWMLYQIWLFIAAGLYPKERKYVTKYLPLSIGLLITGMVFLYTYVLPLMLEFFIAFQIGRPMQLGDVMKIKPVPVATQPAAIPIIEEDPKDPAPGTMWINSVSGYLKVCIARGEYRVINFGSESITTPIITLRTYFDMVIGMLLAFGLAFQLPLVVLALVKIGIVTIDALKRMRRIVYFVLSIVAAVIVPDVVTGMIALLTPLILLYEMGILMAWYQTRNQPKDEDTQAEPPATGA